MRSISLFLSLFFTTLAWLLTRSKLFDIRNFYDMIRCNKKKHQIIICRFCLNNSFTFFFFFYFEGLFGDKGGRSIVWMVWWIFFFFHAILWQTHNDQWYAEMMKRQKKTSHKNKKFKKEKKRFGLRIEMCFLDSINHNWCMCLFAVRHFFDSVMNVVFLCFSVYPHLPPARHGPKD